MADHTDNAGSKLQVLHPVYLDVPMMVSFLASLTGGVSFEDETTSKTGSTSDRGREGGVGIRLPAIGSLFGLDASGRAHRHEQEDDSQEVRAVRQHTAASLFSALHAALNGDENIVRIVRPDDLNDLAPGDVVEVQGEFVGNPLQEIIGFFAQALPYYMLGQEQQAALQSANAVDVEAVQAQVAALQADAQDLQSRASQAERSGNPAVKAEAGALRDEAGEKTAEAEQMPRQQSSLCSPSLIYRSRTEASE